MADTRVHVTLEDFLRVTIADRNEFDSVQEAADELGMTPASFKQRLITSKKRYPALYNGVDRYSTDARKVPDEAEAAQMLAYILASETGE
tara:strand:- start:440 stop:709 length:270 start_codon:yes stop_codon:yes gene_type:complete